MLKAVIFDLDGTLLDTLDDLYESTAIALKKFSFPQRSREEVRCFVGNGLGKLAERAIPDGIGNPCFNDFLQYLQETYESHCMKHTKPYDGIMEMLEKLKSMGYKMAIVSNKPDARVKELAGHFFDDLISVSFGERTGIRKKPAPDSLNAVMDAFGASADECIFAGDSDVDIETAANAGVRCISVSWGFRDAHFLSAHGAGIIIDTPLKLIDVISQYPGIQ
jgi:phosphoglycolate phosphatase